MTMNAIHFDVARLFDLNGVATLGTDLFGGEWSIGVDKQILVLDGVGVPSELKELFEQPGVQILVRGDKNEASHEVYKRTKQVYDFLIQLPENTAINGACYKGFEPNSSIAPLGKDENERHVYSMNFLTYRNAI